MQQCRCDNTYKYPEDGKPVCVICGVDWPDDLEADSEEEALAKEHYFKHLGLNKYEYAHMWDQCDTNYKQAWVTIAKADLEKKEDE